MLVLAGFVIFKENAIKIEKIPRKIGGPRYIHIFNCPTCPNQFRVRTDSLKKHSGKCSSCSHKKLPYKSIFNTFKNQRRKLDNSITYKQFLLFTEIDFCHYCNTHIDWIPYPTINGKYKSSAYNLDRIDNDKGYHFDNCVVSCSRCNRSRSNRFSYKEWYGMTSYFRKRSLTF